MPNWKKLLVSGSDASLQSLNVTNNITISSGSFTQTGSSSISGSLNVTQGITGSLFGNASTSTSASYATSASYSTNASSATTATTATSASYAATASYATNFTVANQLTAQTLVIQTITSSQEYITGSSVNGSLLSNTHQFTGSVSITGSLNNAGAATFSSTLTVTGLTAGSAGNFVVNGGSGLLVTRTAAQVLSDIGAASSSSLSGYLPLTGGTLTGQLLFGTNSTNSMLRVGSLEFQPYSTGNNLILDNSYFNGANYKYRANGFASLMQFGDNGGNYVWYTAPSGTAGNNVTFTPVLTLSNTGAATFNSSVNANGTISIKNYSSVLTGSGLFLNYASATATASSIYSYNYTTNAYLDLWIEGLKTIINPFSGNVLIGTTTDSGYKLDVNGTGRFSGNMTLTATSASAPSTGTGLYLGYGASTNNYNGINFQGVSATDMYFGRAISSDDLVIRTSAGEKIRFTTAGAATFSGALTGTSATFNTGTSVTPNFIINGGGQSTGGGKGNIRSSDSGGGNYWDFGRDNAVSGDFVLSNLGSSPYFRVATLTGAATFSGNVSVIKTTPGLILDGTGGGNSGAYINLQGWAASSKNWQIGVANIGPAGLTLQVSTTAGGGTFTTSVGNFNESTGAYTATSDINKKKDFELSTIGLNAILGLKPTLYRMKDEEGTEKHLGFIAQEVQPFIPQAYTEIGEEDNKFIGLTEMPIISALVKAVQELSAQIEELKALIN